MYNREIVEIDLIKELKEEIVKHLGKRLVAAIPWEGKLYLVFESKIGEDHA